MTPHQGELFVFFILFLPQMHIDERRITHICGLLLLLFLGCIQVVHTPTVLVLREN